MELKDFDPTAANWKLHLSVNLSFHCRTRSGNKRSVVDVASDAIEIYCCWDLTKEETTMTLVSVHRNIHETQQKNEEQWRA